MFRKLLTARTMRSTMQSSTMTTILSTQRADFVLKLCRNNVWMRKEMMCPAFSTTCGMPGVRKSVPVPLPELSADGSIFGISGWVFVIEICTTILGQWKNSLRNCANTTRICLSAEQWKLMIEGGIYGSNQFNSSVQFGEN